MHFLRNLSLLLLSSIYRIHLSSPHHVVFEEIGKMAGGHSYIDAIVPINISGLVQAVHNFHHNIVCLQKVYQERRQPGGPNGSTWASLTYLTSLWLMPIPCWQISRASVTPFRQLLLTLIFRYTQHTSIK